MAWCHNCQNFVVPIEQGVYDKLGKLIKVELVCPNCYVVLETRSGRTPERKAGWSEK